MSLESMSVAAKNYKSEDAKTTVELDQSELTPHLCLRLAATGVTPESLSELPADKLHCW